MAQQQRVTVVVSKDWIDTGVHYLLNSGAPTRSTASGHIIFGNLEDASDHRGLWLKNVRTTCLTTDRSPVTMKLMIPWTFVFAFGVIDEGERRRLGFHRGACRFGMMIRTELCRHSKRDGTWR